MLITPKFVFIHCQKTGGTFVTNVLRRLLNPGMRFEIVYKLRRKWSIRLPGFDYKYYERVSRGQGPHGWCSHIPTPEHSKPILSIMRDPFSFYVSAFTFGWWKRDLNGEFRHSRDRFFGDAELVRRTHPDLGDGSDFSDFLSACWRFSRWSTMTRRTHPDASVLGMCSQRYIYFYSRDPDFVFEAAPDMEVMLHRLKESHYDVHFLRQSRLNRDLYDFLVAIGYGRADVKFILDESAINVSRPDQEYGNYFCDDLKSAVRERDALLLKLFPEYDR